MCGQQIAFDTVGKKAQCVLPFFTGRHMLALLAQTLRDPARQGLPVHGVNCDINAMLLQGGEPGGGFGGLVQPGQGDDEQQVAVAGKALRELDQHGRTFLAGFAGGQMDFNHLPLGEKAQRLAGPQHGTPVEMRAADGVAAAFGKTVRTGGGTDGVGGLLLQKGLVAMQDIQAFEPLLQMTGQMLGLDLHAKTQEAGFAAASRRNTCRATSVRMSRSSNSNSDSFAAASYSR